MKKVIAVTSLPFLLVYSIVLFLIGIPVWILELIQTGWAEYLVNNLPRRMSESFYRGLTR